MVGESQEAVSVGAGTGPSSNKTPTLEEYGTNLTTQASEVQPFPSLSASFKKDRNLAHHAVINSLKTYTEVQIKLTSDVNFSG